MAKDSNQKNIQPTEQRHCYWGLLLAIGEVSEARNAGSKGTVRARRALRPLLTSSGHRLRRIARFAKFWMATEPFRR
jgi:hypothetical protein